MEQTLLTHNAMKYLNIPASKQFWLAMKQYAQDLFGEASRLEAMGKSTRGNPERTSTMIKDADLLLRRGYSHRPKKPFLIYTQIIATVGSFITGLLADANKLKEPSILVIFVVFLTVTITALVIAKLKD
jgi:hypothetical protein